MNFRTDLALERRELVKTKLTGVCVSEKENEECIVTDIEIKTEEAAEKLGKAIGKYITIEMPYIADSPELSSVRLKTVIECLQSLLPSKDGAVVVAGVGNFQMTSDALGPETASHIFSTRHISAELKGRAGINKNLREVVAFSAGVLGQTGIESGEYIKSICNTVRPSFVITIDALASGSITRLGTTIQMSDTGIAPGSGIGNARVRIDENYLGVPVIAIGIPTVVDALSLTSELIKTNLDSLTDEQKQKAQKVIVAPKDIDLLIKNASRLLALSINCALQPEFTTAEMYALM